MTEEPRIVGRNCCCGYCNGLSQKQWLEKPLRGRSKNLRDGMHDAIKTAQVGDLTPAFMDLLVMFDEAVKRIEWLERELLPSGRVFPPDNCLGAPRIRQK